MFRKKVCQLALNEPEIERKVVKSFAETITGILGTWKKMEDLIQHLG